MNLSKKMMGMLLAIFFMLGVTGCTEQEKAAEERGRIPKKILDKAKDQVKDAEGKMKDRFKDLDKE